MGGFVPALIAAMKVKEPSVLFVLFAIVSIASQLS